MYFIPFIFFRIIFLSCFFHLLAVGTEGYCSAFSHSATHTTLVRSVLDDGSVRRRDLLFVFGATAPPPPSGPRPPHSRGVLDHTQRRITVGRIPLDEWSARRRDLYLTTHNTHNRQTPMPPVGFEPTISAGERPQTYALDRAVTGTGRRDLYLYII